ncbi:MAG: RNA 3'-terminal phosphate cyclase [Fimbriimonadaceae bacterium]
MSDNLKIDGSYGEGGGQILRTACSLAAITGRSIEIENIRGKRPKPGLQAQHLVAVKAAGTLCAASLEGAELGSTRLKFEPHSHALPGSYTFEIGTAGSCTLVLQTVLPILAMSKGDSRVQISGGTHNPKAPTIDYFANVFLPTIRRFGWDAEVECVRPGFFPAGGGQVVATIRPSAPEPIDLDLNHTDTQLTCITHGSIERPDLYDRVRARVLAKHPRAQFEEIFREGPSPGVAVTLVADGVAGFSALGAKGRTMEQVADEALQDYAAWLKGPSGFEEYLADQLVLPAIFAQSPSRYRVAVVSEHLTTVLKVVEWFGLAKGTVNDGWVEIIPERYRP